VAHLGRAKETWHRGNGRSEIVDFDVKCLDYGRKGVVEWDVEGVELVITVKN
jgi:hypothetical protein